MTSRNDDSFDDDFKDDLIPRLFRALGPRAPLPLEMRSRWEAIFSTELERRLAARKHRRTRVLAGGFAAAVLLVLTGYLLRAPSVAPDAAIAGTTQVAMVSGTVGLTDGAVSRTLVVGDELRPGQTIRTGPRALLAMTYRDTDVRINSGSVVVMEPTGLQLLRGEVYVDAGVVPRQGPAVIIKTPFGAVTHVGTQFAVSMTDADMTAAVREGAVAFSAGAEHRTISAVDGATEIVVSAMGIKTRDVSNTGGIWDWTADAAPGFVVNDQSADAFLVWATRQTGAKLRYADDAARYHAKTVLLHGSPRPVSVVRGLDVIDATTDLAVDASDPEVVRVSVRGARKRR